MTEYWNDFVQESGERITELNNALLTLERNPDDEDAMDEVFRVAHTLKGNCGAAGLESASELAHSIEDLLDAVRSGSVAVSPELMDDVFDAVDELETIIEAVDANGETDADPSMAIRALRDHLDGPAPIDPPTGEEIEDVLEKFEPPAGDQRAYFVRLSVDESEVEDPTVTAGELLIDALIDAFDLIGTEPAREAIESHAYNGRFDAVFASAVTEAAIASGLDPVDEVADFELIDVTEQFDAVAARTGSEPADDLSVGDPDGSDISPDEAKELEVDELLGEFDQYDDLDELVEEVEDDDDLDAFDDMGKAGSFDDLLGGEDATDADLDAAADATAPTNSADPADSDSAAGDGEVTDDGATTSSAGDSEPTTSGVDPDATDSVAADPDDEVEDAEAVFQELKDEVEMVGFDELQEELEELEFDEFDTEDEVGMDELLGDDVDDDESFLDEPIDSAPVGDSTAESADGDDGIAIDDADDSDDGDDGDEAVDVDDTDIDADETDDPFDTDDLGDVLVPSDDDEAAAADAEVDDQIDDLAAEDAVDKIDDLSDEGPGETDDADDAADAADAADVATAVEQASDGESLGDEPNEDELGEAEFDEGSEEATVAEADSTAADDGDSVTDAESATDGDDVLAADEADVADPDVEDAVDSETEADVEVEVEDEDASDGSENDVDDEPEEADESDEFDGFDGFDETGEDEETDEVDETDEDEEADETDEDEEADETDEFGDFGGAGGFEPATDKLEPVSHAESGGAGDGENEDAATTASADDTATDAVVDFSELGSEITTGESDLTAEDGAAESDSSAMEAADDVGSEVWTTSDAASETETENGVDLGGDPDFDSDSADSTVAAGSDEEFAGFDDGDADAAKAFDQFDDFDDADSFGDDLDEFDVDDAFDHERESEIESMTAIDDSLDSTDSLDALESLDLSDDSAESFEETFGDDAFGASDVDEDFGDAAAESGIETDFDGFDTAGSADDGFGTDRAEVHSAEDVPETIVDEPDIDIPDITFPDTAGRRDEDDDDDESQSVRVDVEQIDELLTLVEGLVTSRVRLRHAVETDEERQVLETELDALEDLTTDLQETVMDVRLIPLQTVANRLPRVVRDIAREQDKRVAFEMDGEDVELDRGILDRISDPLIHLVRNAVDHGIESPEQREEVDKPEEGTVEVTATRSRDRVTITVADDGSGIEPGGLRSKAVDEDVLDEDEAEDLSDDDVLDLVFHPGLSTTEEVTDVSGRGVGMDVVKRTVTELDGTVSIDSEPREGTTVTMTLPVSIAIDDVLFVETEDAEFGLPTEVVHDVESAVSIEVIDGSPVLPSEDGDVPVIRLEEALALPTATDASSGGISAAVTDGAGADVDGTVGTDGTGDDDTNDTDNRESDELAGVTDGVVVRIRDDVRPVALQCATVQGQQEVVVKPFEGFMRGVSGLSGATVRGRGTVVNILDVTTL